MKISVYNDNILNLKIFLLTNFFIKYFSKIFLTIIKEKIKNFK